MNRITATQAALDLLAEIEAAHGPVMFHLSGGCCDGTAPMVYAQGDFRIGTNDVQLGTIGTAPFWTGSLQAEAWADTDLTVDAVPGRGAGFSLDNALDRHFVLRPPTCAS
ncbi:DUF779 domain-containing protein [Paracoccus sp. MC1854]|uniref:DUF779 domain-containing protein n=1 Tax=Paracoccus sp. MC1854 TaxID=2760306 RepID=UPI001604682B|nr:DUF779 domain-containing protein [Paracoccus sp. MC1854]MBB1491173.1 DUF779 domain-containing protein [Paracoccus sp. MC1854]